MNVREIESARNMDGVEGRPNALRMQEAIVISKNTQMYMGEIYVSMMINVKERDFVVLKEFV